MTWKRVSGAFVVGATVTLLAGSATPAQAADLASTFAHDAFPPAEPLAVKPASTPCRQARLIRKARPARRSAPAAAHESGTHADSPPPERAPSQSPAAAVVGHADDDSSPR